MRRIFAIITVLLIGFGFAYEFGCVAICDGYYDLSVTVQSLSCAPIRAVSCEGFRQTEDAQPSLDYLAPPETRSGSASADPFTGQPLNVTIPYSFRESPLGRIWGDSQYRSVLVIVQYQDGQRVGKVVAIPHRRESRSVTVEFP